MTDSAIFCMQSTLLNAYILSANQILALLDQASAKSTTHLLWWEVSSALTAYSCCGDKHLSNITMSKPDRESLNRYETQQKKSSMSVTLANTTNWKQEATTH